MAGLEYAIINRLYLIRPHLLYALATSATVAQINVNGTLHLCRSKISRKMRFVVSKNSCDGSWLFLNENKWQQQSQFSVGAGYERTLYY